MAKGFVAMPTAQLDRDALPWDEAGQRAAASGRPEWCVAGPPP
jgi:hypothetical protein